jgi:hypothetical protein
MSKAPSGSFLHPNDVTDEGMKLLESMLEAAREAHAAALRGKDRSALAVASRDLRYWSARRATARVLRALPIRRRCPSFVREQDIEALEELPRRNFRNTIRHFAFPLSDWIRETTDANSSFLCLRGRGGRVCSALAAGGRTAGLQPKLRWPCLQRTVR